MRMSKVGSVKFRSGSAYAAMLLKRSKLSDSEIARRAGITPQTVHAVKNRMIHQILKSWAN